MGKTWIKKVTSINYDCVGGFSLIGKWIPNKYMSDILKDSIGDGVYFIFDIEGEKKLTIHTIKNGKCVYNMEDSLANFLFDEGKWVNKYHSILEDCFKYIDGTKIPNDAITSKEVTILKEEQSETDTGVNHIIEYLKLKRANKSIINIKTKVIDEETIYV